LLHKAKFCFKIVFFESRFIGGESGIRTLNQEYIIDTFDCI
jgi:hypothetical protein